MITVNVIIIVHHRAVIFGSVFGAFLPAFIIPYYVIMYDAYRVALKSKNRFSMPAPDKIFS